MNIIDDCVNLLDKTLLGGVSSDEDVSPRVVAGLVSLIPVFERVIRVPGVSAALYRVSKRGGIARATLAEKLDFGFAAFSAIPETGSAFSTIFKPLHDDWMAKQLYVNFGVEMIERMLAENKGAAGRWVLALDWARNTRIAVDQADNVLVANIVLLDLILEGQWWCSGCLKQRARDLRPGLISLRETLAPVIEEAGVQIHAFLDDMLRNHAEAVASGLIVPHFARYVRPTMAYVGTATKSYVELMHHYEDLEGIQNAPYKITYADGTVKEGTVDKQGYAMLPNVPLGRYTVEFGEDAREWLPPQRHPSFHMDAHLQKQVQAEISAARLSNDKRMSV